MIQNRLGHLRRSSVLAVVWLATRAWVYLQLNIQQGTHVDFQDVNLFGSWTNLLNSQHVLPSGSAWQYPPGAVFVFLLPGAFPVPHSVVYLLLFAMCDALIFILLLVAELKQPGLGIWVWIAGFPLLLTLPLLRFDVVPTAAAVAALVLAKSRRHGGWVGVAVGIGAAIKVWPVVAIFSLTRRRSIAWGTAAAAFVCCASLIVVEILFGHALSFVSNQSGRGLEIEAVGATPWYVLQAVAGKPVVWAPRNGSLELTSEKADALAVVLHILMIAIAVAIAAAWLVIIRSSLADRQRVQLGIELTYVAVLAFVVLSPVLSPQYFIWLLGVAAVVMTKRTSALRLSVLFLVASVALTTALLGVWGGLISNGSQAAYFLVARNVVLVAALVEAARQITLETLPLWKSQLLHRTRIVDRRATEPISDSTLL
ncbi:glycosyltransferase 87 family protein [Curtobacterium ammoniigenes]|uniref:glycosyltransferase 87 family protein n=1 Tax=Curtobacterium ammoniigenes TaxID=395387 RepID=UPI000829AF80|nr:glycosyltransferase 87 family protein [Curtobacterium ammoniigenes]